MKEHKEFFNREAEHWDERIPDKNRLKSLIEKLNIKSTDLLLDLGTGTGALFPFYNKIIDKSIKITGIDFSKNMLKQARLKNTEKNNRFILGNISELPFKSEKFSKSICFATFPHLTDKRKGLSEITRVTQTRGQIYIAHLMGSKIMNEFHSKLDGIVKYDYLPNPEEFNKLISGLPLKVVNSEDRDDLFLLVLKKI